MSLAIHIIKAVLVVISIWLALVQHRAKNTTMRAYWILVALYWLLNLLSGLIK